MHKVARKNCFWHFLICVHASVIYDIHQKFVKRWPKQIFWAWPNIIWWCWRATLVEFSAWKLNGLVWSHVMRRCPSHCTAAAQRLSLSPKVRTTNVTLTVLRSWQNTAALCTLDHRKTFSIAIGNVKHSTSSISDWLLGLGKSTLFN